ncbi:23S rRNA (adenine(2503)-C(2))-methyltransferase RlmN [bacterium]|nr:23S rRNA (adenine(2503)-C(2))-methyltransferase RlmN [bacterium]
MTKVELKGLSQSKLEAFFAEIGERPFRAKQLMKWLYFRFERDFDKMTDLSVPLRKKLQDSCQITDLELKKKLHSRDGASKFLFVLPDGEYVESVLIPDNHRLTACLSTQVGCPLGCTFCATGNMGFARNLEAFEILGQFDFMARLMHPDRMITNVVFMGMGEPLLNTGNVLETIQILNSELGFEIGARKITLSTIGIPDQIEKLAQMGLKVRLAISLNAAEQTLRDKLMPGANKYPIKTLIKPITHYAQNSGRWVTMEYVMLDGINDSPENANQLVALVKDLPIKVNLIEYNTVPGIEYQPSPFKNMVFFQAYLLENQITATIRKSKGQEIAGACGQLRTQIMQEK